jgi:hypothetical protein
VHLVYLNGAGDSVLSISAGGEKNRHSERKKRATRPADMMSCEQFPSLVAFLQRSCKPPADR